MVVPSLKESQLEVDGRVATLTFMRNDVRNALTGTAIIEDILDTVEWANTAAGISALIITGDGAAFCSGGNIKEMLNQSETFAGSVIEIQDKYRRGIQQVPLSIHKAEIPIIAAVNGPAIGAGFDLACMCDLRIASSRAVVGETFINLGITPGDGGAWFIQRLIGYQRAAELALTGRLVKADEALKMGIFLEVVEPEALLPRARELAAEIASKPPQVVRLTKRMMKLAQRSELQDFLDLCATFQAMAHHTEDHLEAVKAFVEKREPVYRGK
ncbi:MAG: enoyl-CoA hydratase/isomerase family protein [Deltaproteobacteria bacterium]|nr:enoyl-CoA hydratase/isomerase family protein [Deltaproteobacteria bacterium]